MPGDLCIAPGIISLLPLLLPYVIGVTLGASDRWLGTLTRAGGSAKLTFLAAADDSMHKSSR